ncbi:MAG: S-methyl-5'-thioinosine phosphorylase [Gammaproteobacteria bacterium]
MSAPRIAVIGGTGLDAMPGLERLGEQALDTPWGAPSAPLLVGRFAGTEVAFLPRHGRAHGVPPHRINYRANLWALHAAGVRTVIAVAAVGGIDARAEAGVIVVPDQIIDYTWGREHTYCDGSGAAVTHVDFTRPYGERGRAALLAAAAAERIEVLDRGTYGAVQGPRLESAAEIDRMERDGCTIVGMTGMPEAGLARELDIDYACCALVANRAAGRAAGPLTMDDIQATLERGMARVLELLAATLSRLSVTA